MILHVPRFKRSSAILTSFYVAEGFSVKSHFLKSYRKALGAVLKCQLVPLRSRDGGREAFEAFAADDDFRALGDYLGAFSSQSNLHLP